MNTPSMIEQYSIEIALMAVCQKNYKIGIFCKCFRNARRLLEGINQVTDTLKKDTKQKIITSTSKRSDKWRFAFWNGASISALPWVIEDERRMCGVRFNSIYIEDLPSVEDKIKYTVILPLISAKDPNSKIVNGVFNLQLF